MTLNGTEVQSTEHLEQMIVDMPEETKEFLRSLFASEPPATQPQ